MPCRRRGVRMSDDMPTLATNAAITRLFHRYLLFRIALAGELRNVNRIQCPDIKRHHQEGYLFQEGVGEGLYPELEGSEVGRLVQALHLLGHERLMNRLALGISGIHCGAQRTRDSVSSANTDEGSVGPEDRTQHGYVRLEQIEFKNSKKMRSTSARYSCGTSFPWPEEPPPPSFEGEVRLIRRCPAWPRDVPFTGPPPSALDLLSAAGASPPCCCCCCPEGE